MKKTYVVIRTSFIGYHCWPDAPEEVSFLRNKHRHVFFVELWFETSSDRQIEFFIMQRKVNKFLERQYNEKDLGSISCEMMASDLIDFFGADKVEVSEDGENSGVVSCMT